jgi:hypothetical protein
MSVQRNVFVSSKLLAVVEREAQPNRLGQSFKPGDDLARYLFCLLAVRAANQCISHVPFNQRDQVPRVTRPVDIDHALVRNSSSTASFLPGTTPMALTLCAGKILPQDSSRLGVGVDVLVDSFLAHRRPTLQSGSFANHLRRPALFESRLGIDPHLVSESTRAWPLGLGLRLLVRLFRSVAAQPQVARKLPANATSSPPKTPRYLSQTDTALTSAIDVLAFFFGYACVCHVVLLVLWHNTKNVAYRARPRHLSLQLD